MTPSDPDPSFPTATGKPLFPWIGGKRRLAKVILPLIPPDHVLWCDLTIGAGAIFWMKPPSHSEVINDLNGELVNFYRCIENHLEELVRQFKWALVSRQVFKWTQMKRPESLTDIQRAARFYYLQKTAFGGKVVGQSYGVAATSPPRLNLLRIEQDFSDAHLRLARVNIENLPWQKCMERYDRAGTLHFIDPPYYETIGYGDEYGWSLEQYDELAERMLTAKGRTLLTINHHPEMVKRFTVKGLYARTVDHTYTVAGAHKGKAVQELIVTTWPT